MKIQSINTSVPYSKTVFNGKFVDYNVKDGEAGVKKLPFFYPNSEIEKELGSFRSYPTGKVYFANPKEFVNDKTRQAADYVVYDMEPVYPDVNQEVSKNYFGEQRVNYAKTFDDIRLYYYRLEMADRDTLVEWQKKKFYRQADEAVANEKIAYYESRLHDSMRKQAEAAECINIYNQGGDLRYRKEVAEDFIAGYREESNKLKEAIALSKKKMEETRNANKLINEQIKSFDMARRTNDQMQRALEGMKGTYENVLGKFGKEIFDEAPDYIESTRNGYVSKNPYINSSSYADNAETKSFIEKCSKSDDDINTVTAKFLEDMKKRIETLRTYLAKNENTLKYLSISIDNYVSKIHSLEAEIIRRTGHINEFKARLIPLFDKLKNFYMEKGLKTVK